MHRRVHILMASLLLTSGGFLAAQSKQSTKPEQKTASQVKAPAGSAVKGKALYKDNCGICHYSANTAKKIGPGLKGVKSGKLPSGKAATRDVILGILNEGGGGMPAYKELLTEEEKTDVIAFTLSL